MRRVLIIVVAATLFVACHRDVTTSADSETSSANASRDEDAISENAAKEHIGEDMTVAGRIYGLFASSQSSNVYLYFDSDIFHPKFAVVWPGTNHPPLGDLESLATNFESISVYGRIITETNVPEIIVTSWSQITVN